MRQSLSRSGGVAGALLLAVVNAGTDDAVAQAQAQAQAPEQASADPRTTIELSHRHLQTRVGRRLTVSGRLDPATTGRRVSLQVHRGDRWRTLDRRDTRAGGRFTLRARPRRALSAPARLVASPQKAAGRATRRVGRLNVYRVAAASWYGPGLFGNRTGCGGTLKAGSVGVAHKSLPCGARVTLKHGGRTLRVAVIDRGPYVGGREFDLTSAVARRLRFKGHGPLLVTR